LILHFHTSVDKEEILRSIKESRGFIEDFHQVLASRDPEFLEAWSNVWTKAFKHGSLDAKTASLIRMAVVSAIRHEKAIEHSMDQAVVAGASPQEILDAIKIAFIFTGVPTLVTALSIYRKKFGP
jgi:alkylhydroperoxidase/carboxymuconolactone decarboxylase family protein YurZ